MFVDSCNLPELLALKPDYVIDAIDSLTPKCCLIEALCGRGIPFISSMGAALKTDTSCIKLAKLNQTKKLRPVTNAAPKAETTRCRLKNVACVYSDEQTNLPEEAILLTEDGQRNILGSLPTITAVFGLSIANEVIKQLSGFYMKGKSNG